MRAGGWRRTVGRTETVAEGPGKWWSENGDKGEVEENKREGLREQESLKPLV